jgi:hypothetical protein
MSVGQFRLALLVYFALSLASVGVDLIPGALPEALESAYLDLHAPVAGGTLTFVLVGGLLLAWPVAIMGLFLLKRWGRTLALYGTVLVLMLFPLSGAIVASGLSLALAELAAMLWGACLACAYFSPLALQFSAERSPAADASPR